VPLLVVDERLLVLARVVVQPEHLLRELLARLGAAVSQASSRLLGRVRVLPVRGAARARVAVGLAWPSHRVGDDVEGVVELVVVSGREARVVGVAGVGDGRQLEAGGGEAAVAVAAVERAVLLLHEGLVPQAAGAGGAVEAVRVVLRAHDGRGQRAGLDLLTAVAAQTRHCGAPGAV